MSESNLKLWRRHCHTDPANTKPVTFGRKYTAINPNSQLEAATGEWGPYGSSWGIRDTAYGFVTLTENVKGKNDEFFEVQQTTLYLDAVFYYPGGSFPISVDCRYRSGDEARKKLLTEARSKALSLLGFNADIYVGDWDLPGYQDQMKKRFGDQENRLVEGRRAIGKADSTDLAKIVDKIDREAGDGTLDATVAEHLRAAVKERREVLAGNGGEDPRVADLFDKPPVSEGVGV